MGIFRWIRNGKLQVWFRYTRHELGFLFWLTKIGFIQYFRHKSYFEIHILHNAAVSTIGKKRLTWFPTDHIFSFFKIVLKLQAKVLWTDVHNGVPHEVFEELK